MPRRRPIAQWCIPEVSSAYVAALEDGLDRYAEPSDPDQPRVCFDERPCQLVAETRAPLPLQPGHLAMHDFAYRRKGTGNVFATLEPQVGWRPSEVTERRTARDFAEHMKWLVDEVYPAAEVIRVVRDHLNTHAPASLYATFPPAEARRLAKKLECHHTPQHGSGLNMVECELSVLSRPCLSRQMPDLATMPAQTAAWERQRNAEQATVHGHFTTAQARRKLRRLYPHPHPA